MGFWNNEICGFQPQNNNEGTLFEYSKEQIDNIMGQVSNGGMLVNDADGRPIVVPRPDPTAEEIKANLREQRERLLVAFDKYKSNVQYGIEYEIQTQHESMIAWYEDLLDLKGSAFENIPERIKYYL